MFLKENLEIFNTNKINMYIAIKLAQIIGAGVAF